MAKLKRPLLIVSGTLLLLFAVLVVHIRMVTKDKPGHLANIQLARIDFLASVDETEAAGLRSVVAAMPGVQRANFNVADRNLVYAYDRTVQDQTVVFATVNELTDVPCQRLVVTAAAAAIGCPAMAEGGTQDRLGRWIAGLFE